MSKKLPVVSGKDVLKALSKAGFRVVRQRGSHVRMEKSKTGTAIKITVPLHATLKKGTLKHIIDDAGLTTKEFLVLLR